MEPTQQHTQLQLNADDPEARTKVAAAVDVLLAGDDAEAARLTVVLDGDHLASETVAGLVTGLWNCASRIHQLMAGSFIFVEAAAFRQVGGFSHELFAAEELELSQRLKKLARATRRKIVILHRHPIKTSARKMKLYSSRELLVFFARSIFNHRRTVRSRDAAYMWYDGRR